MKILKETNKKKVLHIKIPKNGTHSINNFLEEKKVINWDRQYFFGHDPLYVIQKNNIIDDNVFIFCVVRNPYTRFFSQYCQLKRTFLRYENKTNVDFCLDVKSKNLHPIFTSPQIYWISEEKNNILPIDCNFFDMNSSIYDDYNFSNNFTLINIDKIYKLEKIFHFENDFETKLGIFNKTNYNLSDYKNFFTEDVVNFVKNHYKNDFLTFNYSFDFESSLKFTFSF